MIDLNLVDLNQEFPVKANPELAGVLARTRPIAPHLQVNALERKVLLLVSEQVEVGGYCPDPDPFGRFCPIECELYPLYRRGLLTRGRPLDPDTQGLFAYFITQRGAEVLACFNKGPLFGVLEKGSP